MNSMISLTNDRDISCHVLKIALPNTSNLRLDDLVYVTISVPSFGHSIGK